MRVGALATSRRGRLRSRHHAARYLEHNQFSLWPLCSSFVLSAHTWSQVSSDNQIVRLGRKSGLIIRSFRITPRSIKHRVTLATKSRVRGGRKRHHFRTSLTIRDIAPVLVVIAINFSKVSDPQFVLIATSKLRHVMRLGWHFASPHLPRSFE